MSPASLLLSSTTSRTTTVVPELQGNLANHLNFIKATISQTALSETARSRLQQDLYLLEQRLMEPNFYLAVVGEFSSGKTTLINALLRDELLKTSVLVATAVATQIQAGNTLDVEVRYRNAQAAALQEPNLRHLIHLVTADTSVTKDVAQVRITHLAKFLTSGITIIDTPGANSDNVTHSAITQQVVQEQADAAIVVIPATTPLSQSLSTFLKGEINAYLHRCIFVVTRMDQIRAQQQTALLQDLRSRLWEHLGISDPLIYSCAAQIIIDQMNGESIPQLHQHWVDQFEKLESALLERLQQQRSLAISEKLIRLLTDLFNQLEVELKLQSTDYEQRQLALQQETIPDLATFISQHKADSRQRIDSIRTIVLQQIKQQVEKCRQQAETKIRNGIFNAVDYAALSEFVNTKASKQLEDIQNQLLQDCKRSMQKLTEAGNQYDRQINQHFSQIYTRLNALGGKIQIAIPTEIEAASDQPLNALISVNQQQLEQANAGKLGGIAIGAVIGTSILPGVGTAIGAVIGGAISKLFMPPLQEQQQELWQACQSGLKDYFSKTEAQVNQIVQSYKLEVIGALHQRLDHYATQYERAISTLIQQQQIEAQELQQLRDCVEQQLGTIDHHRQQLSAIAQQLAAL